MNKNIYLIAVFILLSGYVFSQDRIVELYISFDESISKSLFVSEDLKDASWVIKEKSSQTQLAQGNGESLYNYIFENPGEYQIEFTLAPHNHEEENGCFHPDLPNIITLKVHNNSIKYFIDDCALSKDIIDGLDASGTILTIPVEVKSFNGEDVEIPTNVYARGIDANIIGNLDENQRVLSSGSYTLNFFLTGNAAKDTYISFDFEDVNNNIYSFSYTEKIK